MRKLGVVVMLLLVTIVVYGQEYYTSSNGKKIVLNIDLPPNEFTNDVPVVEIADQLALLSEKGLPNCTVSAWIEGTTIFVSITINDEDFLDSIYESGFISAATPLQYMNCIYKYILSKAKVSSNNLMMMYDMYTLYNYQTSRGHIQFQGEVYFDYAFVVSPFFIAAEGYEAKYSFNANRDIMIQLEMPYFRGSHRASYLVYYVLKQDDQISDYPQLEGLKKLE